MSQTRRKGLAILQDEIADIVRVVKNHTENVTRRLEKVKDMTSKYCTGLPITGSPATVSSPPPPSPSANAGRPPLPPMRSIPPPTVRSLAASPSSLSAPSFNGTESQKKSKGPVSWTTFRSKIADSQLVDGSLLKTGEPSTLKKVASLWELAKASGSAGDIEKFLVDELKVEPRVAAEKAPELEVIARGSTAKAASSMKVGTRKKVLTPVVEESMNNWSRRMTNEGTANYERKTQKAMNNYNQRSRSQALAAELQKNANLAASLEVMSIKDLKDTARERGVSLAGLAERRDIVNAIKNSRALAATRLTPGKSRPGASIPALIPFENKMINGKKYALNTAKGSLYERLPDGSMGEYAGEYNASTGTIKNLSL
jgi:hypothetical protein